MNFGFASFDEEKTSVELLRSLCFRGCKSLSGFRLDGGSCLTVIKDGVFQECESV